MICTPTDRRLPRVRVRSSRMKQLLGQRFVVRCTGWDRSSMYPSAHVVRILGPINDLRCFTTCFQATVQAPVLKSAFGCWLAFTGTEPYTWDCTTPDNDARDRGQLLQTRKLKLLYMTVAVLLQIALSLGLKLMPLWPRLTHAELPSAPSEDEHDV